MAIQDNASLALIPSGYKSGKLYSVIPDSGNGDFTHTRGTIGTRVNAAGLIETMAIDVPRLDYPLVNGVVQSCPALLLEPQRINYSIYSEDTSTWTYVEFGSGSAGTITTGKTDMFGGTNAVQIDFPANAENVSFRFGHTTSSISSGSVQTSLYIKLVGSTTPDKIIQLRTGSDAENTTISGDSFVRYTKTHTKASNEAFNIKLRPSEGTSSGGFSIIVCHPQEEVGSYETSYIPTSGSPVTRSADVCNSAGTTAEFNDAESSWFVELQGLAEDNTNKYITISDGGGSPYTNSLSIQYRNNGTLRIFHNGLDFADAIFIGGSSFDLTENHKIAIRFKQNDMAVYIDGVAQSLNGSFVYQTISGLDTLRFEQPNGGNNFYGKVKQLLVFKTALSDSDLATLTS